MAPLFAIVELVFAAAIVYFVFRSFHSQRASTTRWVVVLAAAIVGALAGIWLGFQFRYQVSPELIVYSFPVPGAFHVLETSNDGTQQWIDFVTPAPLMVAAANASFVFSVSIALVWLADHLTCFGFRIRNAALAE